MRPIIYKEAQHPLISSGLFEMIVKNFLEFKRDLVVEVEPHPILMKAKAKMDSVGIRNINDLGRLSLTRSLITTANLQRTPQMEPLESPPFMKMYSVDSWPQKESVIIAEELDLNTHPITIELEDVAHLWIIARRITAEEHGVRS